jgi:nicotinate-nucleotide pyrophosphorylase (carboxylating)
LDDGVVVTSNHISILGGAGTAVKQAKEKLGYLHKVAVEVSAEDEVREAIRAGADVVVIADLSPAAFGRLAAIARELSDSVAVECSGKITPANVREYADAGAQLIRLEALTSAAPSVNISFRVQPF